VSAAEIPDGYWPVEADQGDGSHHWVGGSPPGPAAGGRSRVGDVDGAAFALDAPRHVEALWGAGTDVLWPAGEPALL
jgi:hypothetical protein